MYTERYLPKKYRDSRKRRQRNRIRHIMLIAVLIATLLIGGFFLVKWIAGGSGTGAVPSPTSSASPVSTPAPTTNATETPESAVVVSQSPVPT